MILLVVASESGIAQTNFCWGCRTFYIELQNYCIEEQVGKLDHRR